MTQAQPIAPEVFVVTEYGHHAPDGPAASGRDPSIAFATLRIDARSGVSAVNIATAWASGCAFSQEPDRGDGLASASPPAPHSLCLEARAGAWEVVVARSTSHPSTPAGRPVRCYNAIGSTFVGERPHSEPHATDDSKHWDAVRDALREQDALAAGCGQPKTNRTKTASL